MDAFSVPHTPADPNQLHRELFGFSDDIARPHSATAMAPRPPPSSRPASSSRPLPRPARPGTTARQPVWSAPMCAAQRPPTTTGGLASAKRLVFARIGAAGGGGAAPRRNDDTTARLGHAPGVRTTARRYTRRGSGSTRNPSSVAASSSSASFVPSEASTDMAVPDHGKDKNSDADVASDVVIAHLASTNRYYIAVSPSDDEDEHAEGTGVSPTAPPAVVSTGNRYVRRRSSVDVPQDAPQLPGNGRVADQSPPQRSPQPPANPPQYAVSPWKAPPSTGSASRQRPAQQGSLGGSGSGSGGGTRQTLLQWAQAAGIRTQPPARYAELSAQAAEDVRLCVAPWRRLCHKGRAIMAVYGEHVASLRDRRRRSVTSGRNSLLGLSPDGGVKAHRFADPNHSQLGARPPQGSSRSVTTLRSFRHQQTYGRWCQWQLNHFFEQGPAYLGSVWRHRECGTIMQIADLINGRYVVPTEVAVTKAVATLRHRDRREKLFRDLLQREQGVAENPTDDVDKADETTVGAHADEAEDGNGDCEDDADAMDEPQPRRSHDDTDKASYADVRFDPDTGLLNVSLYVDAPDSDETGSFLQSFVAGCLDGFRWLVLTGPWRRNIMFFQPQYDRPLTVSSLGLDVATSCHYDVSAADTPPSCVTGTNAHTNNSVTEPTRRVCGFHSFCLHGVVFTQETPPTGGGPRDPFVCTRCGNIRAHNPVYVNRGGALARGQYRCWVCRRATTHVRAPAAYILALRLVDERANRPAPTREEGCAPTGCHHEQHGLSVHASGIVDPYARPPQPPAVPRSTVSANLRFLKSRSQATRGDLVQTRHRPRWNGSAHVAHDGLSDQARPLSAAPPMPLF